MSVFVRTFAEMNDEVVKLIKSQSQCTKVCLVVDEEVHRVYVQEINNLTSQIGQFVVIHQLKSLESLKNYNQVEQVLSVLFLNQFGRKDILIAIGGGLCTDLCAFAASIFLRGIKFILVPTTLLATVDASYGGKTGINNRFGKNQIGTFNDALSIVVNSEFLRSLERRQIANGMAEVIKAACIWDKDFFDHLERYSLSDIIDPKNVDVLLDIMRRSLQIKVDVVSQDKFEAAVREILNFGHTLGHAIEFTSNDRLLHGECVSMGMVLACRLADQKQHETRITKLLKQYELPTIVPEWIKTDKILHYLQFDKKIIAGQIRFVLLDEIGKAYHSAKPVPLEKIQDLLLQEIQVSAPNYVTNSYIDNVPGSKSISNRVLLMAAVGQGDITIENVQGSEDVQAMVLCLQNLGFQIQSEGTTVKISGRGLKSLSNEVTINVGESGTTARFITPLCQLIGAHVTLVGGKSISGRPMLDLLEALDCHPTFLGKEGHLPYQVHPSKFGGHLKLKSKVSSQFVSAILMMAPYATEQITLELSDVEENGIPVSEPFIEMTLKLMDKFGLQVERPSKRLFMVPQGTYKNPTTLYVEPDATSATYDMAQVALNGGFLQIKGLTRDSVQGDIGFVDALSQLGCDCEFSPSGVTIRRNHEQRLSNISLDCSEITDTFITLAVVVSTVKGLHKIVGIANQRVKECNRIATVVKNLSKCGLICKELDDGLEIHGIDVVSSENRQTVLLKTQNDHRIAMAFGILGAHYRKHNYKYQIALDNKNCVNKTFPTFWKHIKLHHQITTQPHVHQGKNIFNLDKDSLIFVGMRGAGKSSISRYVAKKLRWEYCSVDEKITQIIKENHGLDSITQFVEQHGWAPFRILEKDTIIKILLENQDRAIVVDCGGGILENYETYTLIKNRPNVIYVEKQIDQLVVQGQQNRPSLSSEETFEDIYNRRKPRYLKVAKHIFTVPNNQQNSEEFYHMVSKSCLKMIKKVLNLEYPTHPIYSQPSAFGCVFLEDFITRDQEVLNALEIRIDRYLQERDGLKYEVVTESLRQQIATIRSQVGVPLILTIRTQEEGGIFKNRPAQISRSNRSLYYEVVKHLNQFCHDDLIDLEYVYLTTSEGEKLLEKLQLNNRTRIILSTHILKQTTEDTLYDRIEGMKQLASTNASVQLIKIIVHEDALNPEIVASKFNDPNLYLVGTKKQYVFPFVTLPMGPNAQKFRVSNQYMTPLAVREQTAPGQINTSQYKQIRDILNYNQQNYYLFGSPISRSPSDKLHNLAFNQLNAEYNLKIYQKFEAQTYEDVEQIVTAPNFMGASVTIPLKQQFNKTLNYISQEAENIGGVVNTIVKYRGQLYGFNTDWWGMYYPIAKNLNFQSRTGQTCVILGYGATALTAIYVSNILQMNIVIVGRNQDKLKQYSDRGYQTKTLSEDLSLLRPHVIINTIPKGVELNLPDSMLENKPIVFFASYGVEDQDIYLQAMKYGCSVLDGRSMLFYQAEAQVQLFNGKKLRSKAEIKKLIRDLV